MKSYTAVVEHCADTGLYVGHVPDFPGAHSQAETLDELNGNLREVIEMLREEGETDA
jgi:predicted RNase H-like HicB family nuclease